MDLLDRIDGPLEPLGQDDMPTFHLVLAAVRFLAADHEHVAREKNGDGPTPGLGHMLADVHRFLILQVHVSVVQIVPGTGRYRRQDGAVATDAQMEVRPVQIRKPQVPLPEKIGTRRDADIRQGILRGEKRIDRVLQQVEVILVSYLKPLAPHENGQEHEQKRKNDPFHHTSERYRRSNRSTFRFSCSFFAT